MKKLLLVLVLACAPHVRPASIPPLSDSTQIVPRGVHVLMTEETAGVLKRYWSAAPSGPSDPAEPKVLCLYGHMAGDSLTTDSATVELRCNSEKAAAALTWVKDWERPDSVALLRKWCAVAIARGFAIVGAVRGIVSLSDRLRIPYLWVCAPR